MKTDFKDFLATGIALGLLLGLTLGTLSVLHAPLIALLGVLYTPIALTLGFLLLYGLYSALALALLHKVYPLRPGDYGVDHPQFALWKVRHIVTILAKAALTPFFPVFTRQYLYALLGARVGGQVAVAGSILDPSLTTLENGCVLGEASILTGHTLAGDRFILSEVRVGQHATVGVQSVVFPGVQVGARAIVLPCSFVRRDTCIPEGEVWGGIPARPLRVEGRSVSNSIEGTETVGD